MIGWYQIVWSGGTPFQTYVNIQPAYFDGSQFTNPVNIPQGSNTLWMSLDVNYQAFPNNNTGQQLAMDIEAVDQGNNTTTRSNKISFNVPLLYTNPVTLFFCADHCISNYDMWKRCATERLTKLFFLWISL